MKKVQKILILLVFVFMLTACSKADDDDDDDRERKLREEAVENVEEKEKFVEIDTERYKAYMDVLDDVIAKDQWPDGDSVLDFENEYTRIEDNEFAICNIDTDEGEELLVSITSTSMAGMIMHIYDYDAKSGEVVLQKVCFPGVDIYDNGVIREYASHNQGPGDLWPYTFSKFDKETNSHVIVGSAYNEEREYSGDAFPTEDDADNDGVIYYITDDRDNTKAATKKEYEEWEKSVIDGAEILYVPWQELWSLNIETIRTLLEVEDVVMPIPLNHDTIISNYDVTGDGDVENIKIVCNNPQQSDIQSEFGSDWAIEINGKVAHDFEWAEDISLKVDLYRVSNQRQYLLIKECEEFYDDIKGFGLYQVEDGKLKMVCDFYDTVHESINDWHYEASVYYMTKEEICVRAGNQFNATAYLGFDMIFKYNNRAWKTITNEFDIYCIAYDSKKEDMTANQSFMVYTNTDCKKEAFEVEKGDVLTIRSLCLERGKTYFKVVNEEGDEGWFVDPEEAYKEINGEVLEGYFEEAMFGG